MFPSALGHVTFLGKLVCRSVLELSSFILFATSALQVLAGGLSYVGWQQAGKCQPVSPVRTSFGCDTGTSLFSFGRALPSVQGLLGVTLAHSFKAIIGTAIKDMISDEKCQMFCSMRGPAKAPSDVCVQKAHVCFVLTLNQKVREDCPDIVPGVTPGNS